jgi:glutamyl-tRNA reductase
LSVVVVGVHERDAPLDLFDRLSVPATELSKSLRLLADSSSISEVVLVSTCMRVEVYAVVERFHDAIADIEEFFVARAGGGHRDLEGLRDHLVVAYDDAAVTHLLEVAAGIDSPVLGEGEILRQVRDAVEVARGEHVSGPVLEILFRHALEAGKRARSETKIASGITSLAHAAVALAGQHFPEGLADRRVLVVGAGEMASGMGRALLRSRGELTVEVTSRTLAHAAELAGSIGGRAVPLARLHEALAQADVVLSSTTAPGLVIDSEALATARASRDASPLVVIDTAVPRDVDPAVGEIPGVTLLDLDDVRFFAEQKMAGRRAEVTAVEQLLADELERYRSATAARAVAPVVAALHAEAEVLRAREFERYARRLSGLDPETREAVEQLTRGIVAKILHTPSVRVKQAAGSARGERLAEALRALFDLQ